MSKILVGTASLYPDSGNKYIISECKKSIIELEKKLELVKIALRKFKLNKFKFIFESSLDSDSFSINCYLLINGDDQGEIDLKNDGNDIIDVLRKHVKRTIDEATFAVKDLERTIIESPSNHAEINSKIEKLPNLVPVINKKRIEGSLEIFGESYDIPVINNAIFDKEILSSSHVELSGVANFETFHIIPPGLYAVTMKFKLLNSNLYVPKKCFVDKSLLFKIIDESEKHKNAMGNYTLEFDQFKNNYYLKSFEFVQIEMDFDF